MGWSKEARLAAALARRRKSKGHHKASTQRGKTSVAPSTFDPLNSRVSLAGDIAYHKYEVGEITHREFQEIGEVLRREMGLQYDTAASPDHVPYHAKRAKRANPGKQRAMQLIAHVNKDSALEEALANSIGSSGRTPLKFSPEDMKAGQAKAAKLRLANKKQKEYFASLKASKTPTKRRSRGGLNLHSDAELEAKGLPTGYSTKVDLGLQAIEQDASGWTAEDLKTSWKVRGLVYPFIARMHAPEPLTSEELSSLKSSISNHIAAGGLSPKVRVRLEDTLDWLHKLDPSSGRPMTDAHKAELLKGVSPKFAQLAEQRPLRGFSNKANQGGTAIHPEVVRTIQDLVDSLKKNDSVGAYAPEGGQYMSQYKQFMSNWGNLHRRVNTRQAILNQIKPYIDRPQRLNAVSNESADLIRRLDALMKRHHPTGPAKGRMN